LLEHFGGFSFIAEHFLYDPVLLKFQQLALIGAWLGSLWQLSTFSLIRKYFLSFYKCLAHLGVCATLHDGFWSWRELFLLFNEWLSNISIRSKGSQEILTSIHSLNLQWSTCYLSTQSNFIIYTLSLPNLPKEVTIRVSHSIIFLHRVQRVNIQWIIIQSNNRLPLRIIDNPSYLVH